MKKKATDSYCDFEVCPIGTKRALDRVIHRLAVERLIRLSKPRVYGNLKREYEKIRKEAFSHGK